MIFAYDRMWVLEGFVFLGLAHRLCDFLQIPIHEIPVQKVPEANGASELPEGRKKPGRKRKHADAFVADSSVLPGETNNGKQLKREKLPEAERKAHEESCDGKRHTDNLSCDNQKSTSNTEAFAQNEEDRTQIARPMRLELAAYEMLLQALYLKGLLSWKQELLLTDARCQLEITNAEHAHVLKEMISSHGQKQKKIQTNKGI